MHEGDQGGDVRNLGRFVGRLLGDELVEIHASGAPTAELFAVTSRPREGFAISRHRGIDSAERACRASGVTDSAVIRIDNEHIVMLVAAKAPGPSPWAAECMLGYVSDDNKGIATSHVHIEGQPLPWRQQLVSSLVEGMRSRREIRIGQLGDFADFDLLHEDHQVASR